MTPRPPRTEPPATLSGGGPGWARLLGSVFLLALAVRVLYLAAFRDSPFFTGLLVDSQWHDEWAWDLARGDFTMDGRAFFRAPLYPYWLSLVFRLLGHDLLLARAVQAALGAGTAALLAGAAARVAGTRAGWVTGALAALYGTLVFFDGEFLIPNLLLFLLAGSAFLLTGRPGPVTVPLAALSLGLAGIARPNALVLLPAAAILVGWRRRQEGAGSSRRSWMWAVGVVGIGLLPALGVTAVNRAAEGTWVFVASQGGVNFYAGNHETASGRSIQIPEMMDLVSWREFVERSETVAESSEGHPLSSGEVSGWWFRRGLRWVAGEPARALGLYLRKAYYLLNANEIPNNRDPYSDRRGPLRVLLWKTPFLAVPWGVIFPLALVGFGAAWRRRPLRPWAVFFGAWFLLYAASLLPFFITGRFRLGLVPPLLILAGIALVEARAHLRGWPLALGALALVVVNTSFAQVRQQNPGLELARRGEVLVRQGRLQEGVEALEEAHRLDPGGTATASVLARTYSSLGRNEEAVALYIRLIGERPHDPDLRFRLGVTYLQLERLEVATREFEAAIRLDPGEAAYWVNLGVALEGRHWFDRAVDAYGEGIRRAPGEELGYLRLAGLHLTREEPDRAARVLVEGVAQRPGSFDLRYLLAVAYIRSGELEPAREQVAALLRLRPSDPEAIRLEEWLRTRP
jgi:tetratricopeptide (TPR) repeat protein